jgi:hypothetical protein
MRAFFRLGFDFLPCEVPLFMVRADVSGSEMIFRSFCVSVPTKKQDVVGT